jgi:hypothetical protein
MPRFRAYLGATTAWFGTDSTRERGASHLPLLFRAPGSLSYVPKAAIIAS